MEDITDADYAHLKREIKNLRKYYDLYVQSDTLLLADVFENFRNMCINHMTLILQISFSSRISMASSFKKRLK